MSNPIIEHYRNAVAMVTAPEAFLELTTIEQGGQTLKAYKHAPGSMRDQGSEIATAKKNSQFL